MEKSEIKIENVSYSTDKKKILNRINLSIKNGELLGIIGPNGAGKTTLLKIICGILNPSSGVIGLEDKNINNFKPKELYKKISYLPQKINFNFPFRVSEIVLMGRYPYFDRLKNEGPEDYKIAKDSLSKVDMLEFFDRNILTLSGGEQQRATIARVVAQDADFLFLDEPLSNMDINHQLSVMNLLRYLSSSGKGVSVVLHDLRLAYRYCSKVLVLNNGEVAAHGSPAVVLNEELISTVFKVRAAIVKDFAQNNSIDFIEPLTVLKDQNFTVFTVKTAE
ncbi:MAG: ABC transporter ATP-binding protein [Thermodesulfobacteriota bacterium]